MTLCHSKVAQRLGLKVTQKDSGLYELYDAQGKRMEVRGMCILYVIPEGRVIPLTLKSLVTPSLEDEEVLLGWGNMVEWGILKE